MKIIMNLCIFKYIWDESKNKSMKEIVHEKLSLTKLPRVKQWHNNSVTTIRTISTIAAIVVCVLPENISFYHLKIIFLF